MDNRVKEAGVIESLSLNWEFYITTQYDYDLVNNWDVPVTALFIEITTIAWNVENWMV